ncbi:MAG: hypothetical protein FWE67_01860 [Planctomycetaceae bacterium]|nr:hypothetical protein [Planctomycetaceae bacterium]
MFRSLLSLFLFVSVFFFSAAAQSAEVPPAEQIFPSVTKGFIAISDLKLFAEQWEKTQFGKLAKDPLMADFMKDVQENMSKRVESRLGTKLDEIQQLPSGEIAAGMVALEGQVPGYVVTLDVSDKKKETADYLVRLSEKLTKSGTKKTTEKYKEHEIIVFTFPEDKPAADFGKESKKPPALLPAKRDNAYYILRDNVLIVSDQIYLAKMIYDRLAEPGKANSLGNSPDYQVTIQRCRKDSPAGSKPLVRWFVEPLNYGESIRVMMRGNLPEKRKNKPSVFSILKEQGFDAIRGIGGTVDLKTENTETIYRVFIYAQKPYKLAMKMFVFPDSANFALPKWLPPDIARCSVIFVDPIAIFDNFGTLFDQLIMQGEEGVWADILAGLKGDPDGPQIDLREEVIELLGTRVLGMSKYQTPITPQSENIVFAVELKNGKEAAMKKALEKLFANDSEMEKVEYKSFVLWHRVPPEDFLLPSSDVAGVPSIGSGSKPKKEEDLVEDDKPPAFPNGVITTAKNCLFVCTHFEYMKEILDHINNTGASISDNDEYKEIQAAFAAMGMTGKEHFIQVFSRSDEAIMPTYELMRQGKMPQSQTIFGKLMNAMFSAESDNDGTGIRKQMFDGSKLPPFEKVQQYFGSSGLFGMSEENGYFIKGFSFEKPSERNPAPK